MLPSARIVVSFGAAASALAALGLVVTLARAEPPEGAVRGGDGATLWYDADVVHALRRSTP